jgi:hypothetical protein
MVPWNSYEPAKKAIIPKYKVFNNAISTCRKIGPRLTILLSPVMLDSSIARE